MAWTTKDTYDFNQSDSGDIGSDWDNGYSGRTQALLIGNRAANNSAGNGALETYNQSISADQAIAIKADTFPHGGGDTSSFSLLLRYAAPSTRSGYDARFQYSVGTSTISIGIRRSGARTELASTTSVTIAEGDTLRAEIVGWTIKAYVNGVEKLSHTLSVSDQDFSSGRPGVDFVTQAGIIYFDDAVIDEWSGAYTITASAGSYVLTGTNASLLHKHLITVDSGSYLLTGQSAALQYSAGTTYTIAANGGVYAITGTDITLLSGFGIAADSGAYTVKNDTQALVEWDANTEPDVAGYRVYHGTAPGVYDEFIEIGNVAITSHIFTDLPNGTHYFAITAYDLNDNESEFSDELSKTIGQAVILTHDIPERNLAGEHGLYVIAAEDATMLVGRLVPADAGAYSLTGTDASLKKGYLITASPGQYVLQGVGANILSSGLPPTIGHGEQTMLYILNRRRRRPVKWH